MRMGRERISRQEYPGRWSCAGKLAWTRFRVMHRQRKGMSSAQASCISCLKSLRNSCFQAPEFAGRLRVIGEVFSGKTKKPDETLEEFGTRHLGREAFQKLIDPMASGVFAGDASKMSLQSCFPRIHEVESEYGSLIRGLIKLQKKARHEGKKDTPGPGPGGNLTSFRAGMSVMTDTLTAELGSRVRVNSPVNSISGSDGQYTLHMADGGKRGF